jgi:hypothetical protein
MRHCPLPVATSMTPEPTIELISHEPYGCGHRLRDYTRAPPYEAPGTHEQIILGIRLTGLAFSCGKVARPWPASSPQTYLQHTISQGRDTAVRQLQRLVMRPSVLLMQPISLATLFQFGYQIL